MRLDVCLRVFRKFRQQILKTAWHYKTFLLRKRDGGRVQMSTIFNYQFLYQGLFVICYLCIYIHKYILYLFIMDWKNVEIPPNCGGLMMRPAIKIHQLIRLVCVMEGEFIIII